MASSNKTTTLELNQWIGTDNPKRTDFNSDNLIIDNYTKDNLYQEPVIVGTQIQIIRSSNNINIPLKFKLDTELIGGNITISLDAGVTAKPLLDIEGNNIISLDAGFVEVVEDTLNFTLRSSISLIKLSNTTITRTVEGSSFEGANVRSNDLVYINSNSKIKRTGIKPTYISEVNTGLSGVTNCESSVIAMPDTEGKFLSLRSYTVGGINNIIATIKQLNQDGTYTNGNTVTVDSNAISFYSKHTHGVYVDASRVLVINYNFATSSYICTVLSVSGNTLTLNTPFAIETAGFTSQTGYTATKKIDTDKFVLHYHIGGANQYVKAFLLDGVTLALDGLGTRIQVSTKSTDNVDYTTTAFVDNNKIIIAFEQSVSNFTTWMRVITFTGVQVDILGIETSMGTLTGPYIALGEIDSTKVVFAYTYTTAMTLNYININGTNITTTALLPQLVSISTRPKYINKNKKGYIISSSDIGGQTSNMPIFAQIDNDNNVIFEKLDTDTSINYKLLVPLNDSIGITTIRTSNAESIRAVAFVTGIVHGIAKTTVTINNAVDIRLID